MKIDFGIIYLCKTVQTEAHRRYNEIGRDRVVREEKLKIRVLLISKPGVGN